MLGAADVGRGCVTGKNGEGGEGIKGEEDILYCAHGLKNYAPAPERTLVPAHSQTFETDLFLVLLSQNSFMALGEGWGAAFETASPTPGAACVT